MSAGPGWHAPLLLLAGANWRDRLVASAGALLGIGLCALISTTVLGPSGSALLLLAPIGASAVLLFGVPASPLAQPWPVLGGNLVAALAGLASARLLGHGALAAGAAVGSAILLMSMLRCLHPPGGGTTLLPVLGGAAVAQGAGAFLLTVAVNAAALVVLGWLFHRVSGHSYPHRAVAAPAAAPPLADSDIDAALAEAGEAFDISREDLAALLQAAERHARARVARR